MLGGEGKQRRDKLDGEVRSQLGENRTTRTGNAIFCPTLFIAIIMIFLTISLYTYGSYHFIYDDNIIDI